jgi:RNA polymerase sigma factor (sigma-70 family)
MIEKLTEYEQRARIAKWVAQYVMPHEERVRAWLYSSKASREEVDDLIQESYCILAGLPAVDHIERPDAYFFSIARNLYLRHLKRQTVIPISTVAEIESFCDSQPSPEHTVANVLDLERVRALIASLPKGCRDVVIMRKIQGLSQREVAVSLGISESMVEWHVYSGIQAILKKLNLDEIWGLTRKPRGVKRGSAK